MGSASQVRLGSTAGCWPGHGALEAAGRRWERQGDGGRAPEWDSKTGDGQWLQEAVVGDGWGSEGQREEIWELQGEAGGAGQSTRVMRH